jgi:hypothetical protein
MDRGVHLPEVSRLLAVANYNITVPNGHEAKLKDTDQLVPSNTGIVIGYSIDKAVELIRQHPVGPVVVLTQ